MRGMSSTQVFPSFALHPPLLPLQIRCGLQSVHNNVSIFLRYLPFRKLQLFRCDPLGRFALERSVSRHVLRMLTTRTGHPEPVVPGVFLVGRCSRRTGGMFLSRCGFSMLLSLLFARTRGRHPPRNPLHPPVSLRGIKNTRSPPSPSTSLTVTARVREMATTTTTAVTTPTIPKWSSISTTRCQSSAGREPASTGIQTPSR